MNELDCDSLYDNAPCGMLVTTSDGKIEVANATFCSWLGYSFPQLQLKKFQELLTVGGRVFHQTHWVPLLQLQGSVSEVQMEMLHSDGSRIPVLINAIRRVRDNCPYDEIAIFVATDRKKYEKEIILSRRQAEQSLQQLASAKEQLQQLNEQLSIADRRKDEFLATLAHELRNPLAPMRNVVEVMGSLDTDHGVTQWATKILSRQVQQMTHLLDDLMDISRISNGRVELRKAYIDLVDLVNSSVEMARPQIEARGHSLQLEIPNNPVYSLADETRLTQVIINLLNNSAKYTPLNGHIHLRFSVNDKVATLCVSDNGIGFEPDEINALFNIFTQLENGVDYAEGGLGIGLSLVKGFVELHDGTISAHSKGPNQGSQFIVTLPIVEPTSVSSVPPQPVEPTNTAKRILIIDDNEDAANSLALLLEMQGHVTATAYSGSDGIIQSSSYNADVILLDIGLPDMSGYDIARTLRKALTANTLLIATTGWGQQKDIDMALEAGFDAHLTKPLDLGKLVTLIS
ncbi:MAG: ATP-binding protein [Ketobacter sp.]|nr:MAG: response regulator [Ketobacter sp.]